MYFASWTNTLNNLDKYILQFGQIHLAIWTNTFCNSKINTISDLEKYSSRRSLISDLIIQSPQCWAPQLPQDEEISFLRWGILLAPDSSDREYFLLEILKIGKYCLVEILKIGILLAGDSSDKEYCLVEKILRQGIILA